MGDALAVVVSDACSAPSVPCIPCETVETTGIDHPAAQHSDAVLSRVLLHVCYQLVGTLA
jgi:hypothetical protein